MSARKKMVFLLLCLFVCLMLLYQTGSLISIFFDIPSLFPLKTYTGKNFSLGYPQNWKITSSDSDGITLAPQSTFLSFPEPEEYIFNDMYLVTQPATSSSPPGAGAEGERAWEQRIPHYQAVAMPPTVTIGGSSWRQVVATYELDPKDGSTIPIEEVALSTVHRTRDGSYLSFLIVFSTNPTIFDRMYQQVLQRIFHSFVFG